jgi:hypothetical protein
VAAPRGTGIGAQLWLGAVDPAPENGRVRAIAALALATCLAGCTFLGPSAEPGASTLSGEPIELATGDTSLPEGCYLDYTVYRLVPDPEFGTAGELWLSSTPDGPEERLATVPLLWPRGYTARRLAGGEVIVLNRVGEVVATTGQNILLSGSKATTMGQVVQVRDRCVDALPTPPR